MRFPFQSEESNFCYLLGDNQSKDFLLYYTKVFTQLEENFNSFKGKIHNNQGFPSLVHFQTSSKGGEYTVQHFTESDKRAFTGFTTNQMENKAQ